MTGYFLKSVVADNLKNYTFWIDHPYFLEKSSMELLLMIYGYSIQFFADFAGYCLIHNRDRRAFRIQTSDQFQLSLHFVTGSAMSMLADEILGKGALFGRFKSDRIKPFSDYYGEELAIRASEYCKADISRAMAPVISDRCGGNPFYITAVIRQAAKLKRSIDDEQALNEVLVVDISSGFIWAELSDQVERWIERTNEYGIAK